jgi:hypothetical protein
MGEGQHQQHLGWTLLSQPTRPACARLLIKNPLLWCDDNSIIYFKCMPVAAMWASRKILGLKIAQGFRGDQLQELYMKERHT